MATPKACNALKKAKEAIDDIKDKLEQVVQRLKDDAFEKATAQAQATVSLSIGMMKYIGARLQGLDHGRNHDDALRQELNQMRKVLAEIKARNGTTRNTSGRKESTSCADKGNLKQISKNTKEDVENGPMVKKIKDKGPPEADKGSPEAETPLVGAAQAIPSSSQKRKTGSSKQQSKKKRKSK
jgi:hypothetical protein